MASRYEMGERRVKIVPEISKKPLLYGLRGEDLFTQIRPSQTHTNGAKEALKAQQF